MNKPALAPLIPQNHFYDGWVYRLFIDPSLAGIRHRVARLVPHDSRVLDVGCGTGDQLRLISRQISYGLGVELSQVMVETAQLEAQQALNNNCEFRLADASRLDDLSDQSFDIAMCSLMIHEMPEKNRLPVLREMKRLARQIIVVDWICPQPSRLRNWGTHFVEYLAGREHFAGFRSFLASGGMPVLLEQSDLEIISTQITTKDTMQLWVCEPRS